DIYYKNKGSIEGDLEVQLETIKDSVANLLKINNTFNNQLKSISVSNDIPESNEALQVRFVKAINYFEEQTKFTIERSLNSLSFTTDNKAIDKEITKHLDTLDELLAIKQLYFKGLQKGFDSHKFLELRARSVFVTKEKPKKQRKTFIDGTSNIELFELLRALRNEIAKREDLAHFQVFTQKSLYAMCELLPNTKQELKSIHGMGKKRMERYGDEILQLIKEYCGDRGLKFSDNSSVLEKLEPKTKKIDTKQRSLQLFKTGKSLDEIADERRLNPNTIFGHLASFISSGEVEITDLMSETHFTELKEIIPAKTFENLSDLKHQLDDKYDYGELRLVINELSRN
ncbi:helix-turn-helix domain-containing protein, partial [Winogradskyella sp.]